MVQIMVISAILFHLFLFVKYLKNSMIGNFVFNKNKNYFHP
ncbi:MAG: hypothetical protein JWQ30_1008 [Sediminibacterium sp.]|nr:hypothetical protein [Sediminibacterium sp.]